MHKNAIQKFAIWARNALIAQVSQRAYQYGMTPESCGEEMVATLDGRALSLDEQKQRRELVKQIQEKGFLQVMEEVAYTWFNRFIALRFMEVNNYLPSHIRMFSDSTGAFKPEILNDALHLDLQGLNPEKVAQYIESNDTENLYRYLLLTQCNALNEALPLMFEKMGGYTEMLLPNNILKSDSILGRLVSDIPEDDWKDAVQIIGWLYQYYNFELKDETFALLKKNIKIAKERIPAATQLFTPDWIVRYMVENSLGRIWLEGHPNAELRNGWKYYLDEAQQEPEVESQLAKIREAYKTVRPEGLKLIDPCMGSGHILVYAFDIFMQIYTSAGWDPREAAQSILKNNLYGLDIDNRAAQLAYFAVMMKARQYDRRLFNRGIQPHIYAIVESNPIPPSTLAYFHKNDLKLQKDIESLASQMYDAKEYGAILNLAPVDFVGLYQRFDEIQKEDPISRSLLWNTLLPLVKCAEILAQKYDVVVTNPPYMGASGMSAKLSGFVKKNYPDSKSDLFAVFIEKCGQMAKENGYQAMITQHAWMFLSSFEKLRSKLLSVDIVNMAHLGARAFEEIGGEVVQTTSFVIRKSHIKDYKGEYCRLIEPTTQQGKEDMFLAAENRYEADQSNFSKIPGSPVAYWVSKMLGQVFTDGEPITKYVSSRDGLTTGNNDLFIRYFWEISLMSIGFHAENATEFWKTQHKFAPLIKGGLYRKWYGNNWFVITYDQANYNKLSNCGNKLPSREIYFMPYITWNRISTRMAFRYCEGGYLFESASLVAVGNTYNSLLYALAFSNSAVSKCEMELINPTTNMLSGYVDLLRIPEIVDKEHCETLANECVNIAKEDWDSYETSWDFRRSPLV